MSHRSQQTEVVSEVRAEVTGALRNSSFTLPQFVLPNSVSPPEYRSRDIILSKKPHTANLPAVSTPGSSISAVVVGRFIHARSRCDEAQSGG